MVYTSSTLSLAALELLVHLDPEDVPDDLVAMTIEVPDDARPRVISRDSLPRDWSRVHDHPACAAIGDAWVAEGSSLLLLVPSAVVPEEWNLLINPGHPRAREVKVRAVRPFSFDPRLV